MFYEYSIAQMYMTNLHGKYICDVYFTVVSASHSVIVL